MNPTQAAAQIAQERVIHSVAYPLTGDREIDAISGLLAVLDTLEYPHGRMAGMRSRVRVLKYVLDRMESALAESKRLDDNAIGQGYAAQSPGLSAQQIANDPRKSLFKTLQELTGP